MPSLDIVCRVDYAELDNALNNTKKAIAARFDFKNSPVEITVDKKEKKLQVWAEDKTKQEAVKEMFLSAAMKRGFAVKTFDFKECEVGLGGRMKREVKIRDGLEQDAAKALVKTIKATGLKVQASIQGEEVRLTGKQIDDLQAIMAHLKTASELPLQYVNMKRD
jgi:uncharacterized protein YajQ (UPF0234 family)